MRAFIANVMAATGKVMLLRTQRRICTAMRVRGPEQSGLELSKPGWPDVVDGRHLCRTASDTVLRFWHGAASRPEDATSRRRAAYRRAMADAASKIKSAVQGTRETEMHISMHLSRRVRHP